MNELSFTITLLTALTGTFFVWVELMETSRRRPQEHKVPISKF